MSSALARALVVTEVVPWSSVAQALYMSTARGVPFVRALLETGAIGADRLDEELARADAPTAPSLEPDEDLVAALPPGLCARLLAVPVGSTKTPSGEPVALVAMADARDAHAVAELSFHLGAEVQVMRAPRAALEQVLQKLPGPAVEVTVVESTLVSLRAPEGIVLPPSERRPDAPSGSRSPSPPSAAAAIPLVRRSTEPSLPIPLVRRAEAEPVLELRSPYSRAPRAESAASTAILAATDRNEILRLWLEGAKEHATRVMLLAVRKDGFGGLLATDNVASDATIKEVRVPVEGPSALATAAAGGTYLGPIYAAAAHKALIALLPHAGDIAVTAARLRGRPMVLMLAEGMAQPATAMRHLDELTRAAGEAFAKLLATKAE